MKQTEGKTPRFGGRGRGGETLHLNGKGQGGPASHSRGTKLPCWRTRHVDKRIKKELKAIKLRKGWS